jgi:hypothetical protein
MEIIVRINGLRGNTLEAVAYQLFHHCCTSISLLNACQVRLETNKPDVVAKAMVYAMNNYDISFVN